MATTTLEHTDAGSSLIAMYRDVATGNRWNNVALVADSSVLDANVEVGMVASVNSLSQNGTATTSYNFTVPAALTANKHYQVLYYASPYTYGDIQLGYDHMYWDGTTVKRFAPSTAAGIVNANVSSVDADAITAAAIANSAIDNATFAADVGSTTYADNIVALAVRKALDELGLDKILKLAVSGSDVTDNSLMAKLTSKSTTADWDSYNNTTDSLEAIRDRGDAAWNTSGGTGSGARTITITVDDGSTALENAKVRVTSGSDSYVTTTNVSGIVVFALDDATWTVSITKSGYTFTPVTLAVSADTAQTYSMTQVSIPASDPDLVTGYLYVYDEDGVVEEGADLQMKFVDLTGTGFCPDTKIRTETSDSNGLVSFTNLFTSAEYKMRRGQDRAWKRINIPSTASGTYAITNFGGYDD